MSGGFNYETSHRGESDTWLTPPHIYQALGKFDLDPCAHPDNPTASRLIVLPECGLAAKWEGRVWCNPPYGPATKVWLDRMAQHGAGTALVLSRTDTKWFHKAIAQAQACLFLEGRLKHLKPGMIEPSTKSGATCGSVLIAFGQDDADALMRSSLTGWRVDLR
jgi:hypothetical protein